MPTFDEYQEFTHTTAIYPQTVEDFGTVATRNLADWVALSYPIIALNGEAGELAELVKKAMRDEAFYFSLERKELMRKELGDVLYCVARIAHHLDVRLDTIAADNMQKLQSRKDRGVLSGSGSDR